MDPGPPKSTSKPVPLSAAGDTANTRGTVVAPFADRRAVTDSYLLPPQRPDEIGRLGRYRVLAELGRGGMGAVYRAEDPTLERVVALKVLLPELAADPGARERFVREAKAQAKVEHDHIIAIHAVEEADGVAFIVMPLLKGTSLAAALQVRPRPPLAALVRIGKEIAEGLSAAHAAGLIHRDIKPANVWLEGDRARVKILDFGVAQTVAQDGGGRHTASGAVVGSPAYMSPEQAHGRPVDPRTDLFALGVLLYEMATGRRPFTGPSVMDVLAAVVAHDPTPAADANPNIPPALSHLIARLMAKDPANRPATAADAARELDAIGRAPVGPIPVVVAAAGESNPWAELDSAPPDDESDDEPDDDATVVTRAAPPAPPARRWVGPAVAAGAVAVLVVGGLLVARPWKGKAHHETADPTPRTESGGPGPRPQTPPRPKTPPESPPEVSPTPPQPKPSEPLPPPQPLPDKADDRKAAEWAVSVLRGPSEVAVRQNGKEVVLYPGNPLPAGPLELVKLKFNINPAVTDDGLANLTGCANLTYLSLAGTAVTDAGLKHLRGLTALEVLHLEYTRVTARGLAPLRDSTKLAGLIADGVDLGDDVALVSDLFPAMTYLRVTNAGVSKRGIDLFHRKCVERKERDPALPDRSVDVVETRRPEVGLAFDGKDAGVTVADLAFDGKLPLTLEAWVTPRTVAETHFLLFSAPGGGMGLSRDGAFGAGLFDGNDWQNAYGRDKLRAGATVHVAAVLAADRIVLYVDGRESGTRRGLALTAAATRPPAVVGRPTKGAGGVPFHGVIHGLRVTAGARYERDFLPAPPDAWLVDKPTVVLYRFDEGTGERLTDSAAGSRHGVIRGARWVAAP